MADKISSIQSRVGFWGTVLLFAACAGLGVLGWNFVRHSLSERAEYRLSAERIRVSETPPWIPTNFVDAVLRSSGLTSASLLDAGLSEKLAKAFAADSWVESVVRVELRFPSGAEVVLTYRRPVAVVEVAQGLLPVDPNGVLLRTDYFIHVAPEKKNDYLRVSGIRSTPLGGVGTAWGDPLVHSSAQLAAFLEDVTKTLALTAIVPGAEQTATGTQTVFRLKTAAGTEFHWGRFDAADPKNDAGKKRLLELVRLFGSLDQVPPSQRSLE